MYIPYLYRYQQGRWSTEGVKTENVTRVGDTVTVVCSSTHLTSFAVLIDVGGGHDQASTLLFCVYGNCTHNHHLLCTFCRLKMKL